MGSLVFSVAVVRFFPLLDGVLLRSDLLGFVGFAEVEPRKLDDSFFDLRSSRSSSLRLDEEEEAVALDRSSSALRSRKEEEIEPEEPEMPEMPEMPVWKDFLLMMSCLL